MSWEPGLRWLCGLEIINAHTLCDFRIAQKEKLEALLVQLLAVLSGEGLVDFATVIHDGTKIQARAGKGSAQRRPALETKLARAQAYLEQLDCDARTGDEPGRTRQQAARERAAREGKERLEAALEEMRRQEQSGKKEPRVSATEPESRPMRHTEHGGWMHSYNVQLSTESKNNFIVGVSVTNDQNDTHQLEPAFQTAERFTQHKPQRIVADRGYVTRESVEKAAEAGVELMAPVKDEDGRRASALKRNGIAPEFSRSHFVSQPRSPAVPGRKAVAIHQAESASRHSGEDLPSCR